MQDIGQTSRQLTLFLVKECKNLLAKMRNSAAFMLASKTSAAAVGAHCDVPAIPARVKGR
jgi:hypothetical protein